MGMIRGLVPLGIRRGVVRTWHRRAWYLRRATAGQRLLPSFLIIGAQKAGTTSLFRYLEHHPAIGELANMEVNYFQRYYPNGEMWYRAHFARKSDANIAGESSPNYLPSPQVARRASETVPGAKIIVLLRNPVDRAYSHYHHNLGHEGREPLSFEEATEAEPERINGELERLRTSDGFYYSQTFIDFSYLYRGCYAQQLKEWLDAYPGEQMMFIQSEVFFSDPRSQVLKVFEFLNLDGSKCVEDIDFAPRNTGSYKSTMKPDTRERLEAYFKPHNEALYKLIGVDFDW